MLEFIHKYNDDIIQEDYMNLFDIEEEEYENVAIPILERQNAIVNFGEYIDDIFSLGIDYCINISEKRRKIR